MESMNGTRRLKENSLGRCRFSEAANAAKEQARDYAERGMEYANDYSERLGEFVQREPWIAMGEAFVIGYTAAKLLRSVSR
jgi:ElaB/YqjD/DUF883 family membrane-anchored ribosome-binding protein